LRDEAPRMRGRWFSRRDAVSASANTDRTQTGGRHDYGRARERLVAKRRRHMGWRHAVLAGVRSPSLRGGLARHGWPCGERSEMTPRQSSRRGAVSAPALPGRTQTEARHDQRGQSKARGPNGAIPRWKQTLIYGRAEPVPPREVCPTRIACKGAIRSGRKPIFSEGRTLCARIERPSPCRGISLAEMARRAARGPIGRCPDEARAFLPGVRSPPLRGGLAQHGWPCGERSEMTPRESSRRGAVSAPVWQGRTLARVRHDQRGVGERPVA